MNRTLAVVLQSALVLCCIAPVLAHSDDPKILDWLPPYEGPGWLSSQGPQPRGTEFTSVNVALGSWISLADFGTGAANGASCWGYTSPSGREYAILGMNNATGFVEITNPNSAQIVAVMPGPVSLWREMKTYSHYCYVVNQDNNSATPGCGIQIFDLGNIDGTTNRVVELPNVTTGGSVATHTITVDEVSGFLYRNGGTNSTGLRIYSLANPASPAFVAAWPDRYVHDSQVVTYTEGPYAGKQIAFCCGGFNGGFGETGLDILDVTDKQNIVLLSRTFYSNAQYSHQGWLSADRQYFYIDDELDERDDGDVTTTTMRVMNVANLSSPFEAGTVTNGNTAIDHNLYVRGDFIFCANYRSGLRIFNATNPAAPYEVGYFDTYPEDDSTNFNGAWGNFPFYASGTVIVSDMNRGLFVLDPSAALKALKFSFPDGVPTYAHPDGSTSFRVLVEATGTGVPLPGSARLHFNAGSGFQVLTMTELSPNEYLATLPATACGQTVSFYVSAQTTDETTFVHPLGAPATAFTALSAFGGSIDFTENFETDNGWTPSNLGATAGLWQRGVPYVDPNWTYGPTADGDGSGQCWLTENVNNPNYAQPWNTDVDNGSVRLTSPILDLSGENIGVEYLYYLRLTDASGVDRMLVEINTAGGVGTWTQVALHTSNTGSAWAMHQITAQDFAGFGVTPTANSVLRFTVNDANPQTVVEAALDGFRITSLVCEPACAGPTGDLDDNGLADGRDVSAFVHAALGTPTAAQICSGDFTGDGALDSDDTPGLVAALLSP